MDGNEKPKTPTWTSTCALKDLLLPSPVQVVAAVHSPDHLPLHHLHIPVEDMQVLQDMLHCHHPGVQLYKTTFELTRDMPPEHQCIIALHFDETCDRRRYNLTTASSNKIAASIPGSGDEATAGHDIILHRKAGEGLKRISELHPFYPALHYVLLFPTGQLGWHPQLEYGNGAEANDEENASSHHLDRRWQEQVLQSASRCPCGSFWLFISIHASSPSTTSFTLASSFMSIWWIHGPYVSRNVSTTCNPTRESCAQTSTLH